MPVFALKDKLKHIWCPAVLVEIKSNSKSYFFFNFIFYNNEYIYS
jgi:hypothetical protein